MATNPYVNKVVYGNQTVMDISGDTVTASDVAQGKTFHDATGEQKTGSYVAPTITQITPSNSSPVTLTSGNNYQPTANGKAVASITDVTPTAYYCPQLVSGNIYTLTTGSAGYLSSVDIEELIPSNLSPARLSYGGTYHIRGFGGGYAIESYNNIIPTNVPPTAVSRDDICHMDDNGYVISSYSSKAPDDTTPPSVSSGEIVLMGGAGYLYASQQTTTSVTPSDSNPPQLTANTAYKPTANGYLYETQVTPGFPYTKSGTLADFTTANQEQSVDTGLSSVKYVYLEALANNGAIMQIAQLDTDRTAAKQIALFTNTSATTSTCITSGTNAAGVITANGGQIKVSAISGGTITVKTGNAAAYFSKSVKWYAG